MITFLKGFLKLLFYFVIGYVLISAIASEVAGYETIKADRFNAIQSTYNSAFLSQYIDFTVVPEVKLAYPESRFLSVHPEAAKFVNYARNKTLVAGLNWSETYKKIECEGGEISFLTHDRCSYAGCDSGVGPFQIIPSTEAYCSSKLGRTIDRANFYDNIDCGIWLLANEGDKHWRQWSGHCWDI